MRYLTGIAVMCISFVKGKTMTRRKPRRIGILWGSEA